MKQTISSLAFLFFMVTSIVAQSPSPIDDGEICGGFMALTCPVGYVCLGSKGKYPGLCRKTCNSSSPDCPNAPSAPVPERTCIKGVCLPALAEGDPCNVKDKLFLIFTGVCDPQSNLVCKNGVCVQVSPVNMSTLGSDCPCSPDFVCSFNQCVNIAHLGDDCKGSSDAMCDDNLICWGGTIDQTGVCYPAPPTYGKLCYMKKGTCGPYYTCYNPKPGAKIGVCSPAALPDEECDGKVRRPKRCTKGYVCMKSPFDPPTSPGVCKLPEPLSDFADNFPVDSGPGFINNIQTQSVDQPKNVKIDPLTFAW